MMDWNAILERAERRGHFTEPNKKAAGEWRTCAVGERSQHLTGAMLTNREADESLPLEITSAGIDFGDAVENDDLKLARKLYTRIQRWGVRRKAKA